MATNKLIFQDAVKARDAITESQKQEIAKLYSNWADEIGERANYYKHKATSSSWVSEQQMRELQKQLRATSQQVSNEVYNKVKSNIYTVADSVVQCNAKWLAQYGFSEQGINVAFSSVPDSVVRNIITGQIYDSGWSLSQRIWGNNEQTLKDIYGVIAKGLAENRPLYDIAKNLEAYVRPGAKLPWNLEASDGVKIYPKQVDYNAQRLARTLIQHGYQQSFIATTKDNPFILEYVWVSNGSRACPLCMDRDGQHFKKYDLPMDHPNGMCVMEPVVVDNMVDQLADWFNSEDGTYPEIDEFAKSFGYTPTTGITTGKQFAEKYGTSTGAKFNYWYSKLDDNAKAIAKDLKEQSGLTWQQWYEQNIKVGNAQVTSNKAKTVSTTTQATTNTFDKDKWISMIKSQKEKDMLAMEERAFAQMSEFQKDGLSVYTGNSYVEMNAYFRNRASGMTHNQAIKASGISDSQLEHMWQAHGALKDTSLEKDLVLRRGTDLGDLAGFMSGDFYGNKSKLESMSIQELQAKFEGTLGTYAGFTSTSSIYDKGFSGEVEMIIYAPKGTPASSIMSISKYGTGEGETLLNAGTTVRITKIEESDGHRASSIRVFAEVILDD